MHGGLEIDHGAMKRAASNLVDHGDDYRAALQRLRERSDGSAWGDDGLFAAFVAAYNQCAWTALQAYSHMGTAIGDTGDALTTVRQRVSSADGDSGDAIRQLPEGLGPTWV